MLKYALFVLIGGGVWQIAKVVQNFSHPWKHTHLQSDITSPPISFSLHTGIWVWLWRLLWLTGH